MSSPTTPCPVCGSTNSKPIFWTNEPGDGPGSAAPEIGAVGGRRWNDGPRPNRLCAACGGRFCSDPSEQQRFDEAMSHRSQRFESTERDCAWFSRGTALDQVADAVIRKLRLARRPT